VDRESRRYAVLALLGILAVALSAATLPTAVQPEPRGDGGSGLAGTGDGGGLPIRPPPEGSPGATFEIPFLSELFTLLALLALVAILGYLFVHRRGLLRVAVAALAPALVVALILYFLSLDPSMGGSQSRPLSPGNLSGGGGGGSGRPDSSGLPVAIVLTLVLGTLVTLVAVQRWWGRLDESTGDDAEDANGASGAVEALGRVASQTATRIAETQDVDNEVYRAWRQMTTLLDVERPETNTPGEFAAAAVDAGMEPADVRELTELFELVRYGGYDLDAADERRAVELFRRLERRYAEENSE